MLGLLPWDEYHTGVFCITKFGKLSAKYYSVSKKSVRTPKWLPAFGGIYCPINHQTSKRTAK